MNIDTTIETIINYFKDEMIGEGEQAVKKYAGIELTDDPYARFNLPTVLFEAEKTKLSLSAKRLPMDQKNTISVTLFISTANLTRKQYKAALNDLIRKIITSIENMIKGEFDNYRFGVGEEIIYNEVMVGSIKAAAADLEITSTTLWSE